MVKLKPLVFQTTWQCTAVFLIATAAGLIVNQWRSDRIPLIGDWSQEAQLTLPSGANIIISLEEAEAFFFTQTALFLDARPHGSYKKGHIEGARSVPWEDFEEHRNELMRGTSKDAKIIAYCDGETCGASRELAFGLIKMGYSNVRVLVEGWEIWKGAGLPVERGIGTPPPKR